MQITTHCIVTIQTKLPFKCITVTPFILEAEIDEIVIIQNPQLVMLSMVYLTDKVKPVQVPLCYVWQC